MSPPPHLFGGTYGNGRENEEIKSEIEDIHSYVCMSVSVNEGNAGVDM